jgi:hypothetical protein
MHVDDLLIKQVALQQQKLVIPRTDRDAGCLSTNCISPVST